MWQLSPASRTRESADDCLVSVLWCRAQRAESHAALVLFPPFRYYAQRLRTCRRSLTLSQVERVVRGVVRCCYQMSRQINMTSEFWQEFCELLGTVDSTGRRSSRYNGECWAVSLVHPYKPVLETLTITYWYLRREGLPHQYTKCMIKTEWVLYQNE